MMGLSQWAGALAGLFTIIIGVYKIWFSKGAKIKKYRKKLYAIQKAQRQARTNNDEPRYLELESERLQLLEEIRHLQPSRR